MRLCTTLNPFVLENPTVEAIKAEMQNYKNLGFDILDCILCDGTGPASPLRLPTWRAWGEGLAAAAQEVGITFAQAHMPMFNFAAPGWRDEEDLVELTRRTIVIAGMLGAPWIVGHPATAHGAWDMPVASRQSNLSFYAPLVELARKQGLGIALENMADFPQDPYPRGYCATAQELCELVDAFRDDHVGVCWDFGHANLMYRDQSPCLRSVGPRLKAVHVHDNHGGADSHLPVFFGNIQWPPLVKTLRDIGYGGVFSFEIKRIPVTLPQHVKNAQWEYARVTGEYLLGL